MDNRTYLVAALSGILSEVFIFSKGEWDRYAPAVVNSFTFLGASTFLAFKFLLGLSFTASLKKTTLHSTALLAGLFGSIGVYRLFLHPLRAFPGPLPAKITAWWIFKENCPDLKFYIKLRKLHDEYGDYVRIRPREISICHPDAVMDVHGPKSKVVKGEFYAQAYPHETLQFTRDPALHRKKRPVWDKAFQNKSVKEYMPRLEKHYGILMDIFSQHAASGKPINATQSFTYLGYDLISELIFGESFELLPTGKTNVVTSRLIQGKKAIGFAVITTWHTHILRAFTRVGGDWMNWYNGALDKRKAMDLHSPDIYTHLSQSDTWEFDRQHEARLAIAAGSDTVAITLTNICWFLSQCPDYQSKLFDEVGDLPSKNGLVDDQLLAHKPLLLGIINEALRLQPPVPSGVQRLTPPEGAVIAGRYIPGNTVVSTPTYSLHRDKRAFAKPDEFIPERWDSQPELTLRKDAFIPFSYGPYNCAGKSLAMMELRMIVAMLVKRFIISFPPGKEKEARSFIEEQADCFSMDLPPLLIVLKERSSS